MKSNEYYKMCSEIKQITDRICSLIAKKCKKFKSKTKRYSKYEARVSFVKTEKNEVHI